jgi:MinD superfamily P-loop ATPase
VSESNRPTIIAIASGKGGTGKTTLATNIAWIAARRGLPVAYLDCDVEEPNGHLFLKPHIEATAPVTVEVPEIDAEKCTLCGACTEICRFNALASLGDRILVFEQLCHSCGGCWLVCPEKAIREKPREVGVIEEGRAGAVGFVHGRLRIGEAMATPVIRAVKDRLPNEGLAIFDAPPGTSCPVIETVSRADHVVLVTEPTPFGLHDLELAVDMVEQLGLPFSVAINRSDAGDDRVRNFCLERRIEILAELPDDRRVAEAYSRGEMAAEAVPEFQRSLEACFDRLCDRFGDVATGRVPS